MKKKIILISILALNVKSLFAQIFGDFAQDMHDEIIDMFPIIIGAVFVVGAMFNAGSFWGDNRDIKKGFTNIAVYCGGVLAVVGVFTYLTGLSL